MEVISVTLVEVKASNIVYTWAETAARVKNRTGYYTVGQLIKNLYTLGDTVVNKEVGKFWDTRMTH